MYFFVNKLFIEQDYKPKTHEHIICGAIIHSKVKYFFDLCLSCLQITKRGNFSLNRFLAMEVFRWFLQSKCLVWTFEFLIFYRKTICTAFVNILLWANYSSWRHRYITTFNNLLQLQPMEPFGLAPYNCNKTIMFGRVTHTLNAAAKKMRVHSFAYVFTFCNITFSCSL